VWQKSVLAALSRLRKQSGGFLVIFALPSEALAKEGYSNREL